MSETKGKKSVVKWVVLAVVALLGIKIYMNYVGLVNAEENIGVADKKMYTSIDAMVKKIQGAGYVVDGLEGTLTRVLTAYVGEGGRGGNAGGAGLINAVHEAIPEVPREVFVNMADTINSSTDTFRAAQDDKSTRIGELKKKLRYPLYMVANIAAKVDTEKLAEMDILVVGGETKTAQKTKQIDTIDPFANKREQ